ncbi:PAS domain S-box protein [Pigmentiphaga sp. YJ18]|uniref:PAS domain S-box protein n=1 Tax=Pigmentiphaga sp. YJ18 TaxID=3134907 RepID=UPI003117CA23
MDHVTNYQEVFEYANDIMVIHDKDTGEILQANRKACEMYGCSPDQLRRLTIGDLTRNLEPYNHAKGLMLVRRAATTAEGILFEWVVRDRVGHETSVEVSLKPITLDGIVRVIAIARDITERKQAEAALRQKERHYRRLIERSSDGIAILSISGLVRFAGPSIQALLGVPPRFATGRSAFDFLSDEDAARFESILATLPPEADTVLTYRIRHRDGTWRVHEANCRNLTDDPAVSGILINFRDVTLRVQDDELARQRERQFSHIARLSTTGEMAAALAHELNQPFFSILNFVAGCRRQLQSGNYSIDGLLAALELAQKEAERAGKIVNTVRSFTCKGDYQRRAIDLRDLVRGMEELIAVRARHACVALEFDLDAAPCWVECDEVLIQQVIINLAVNGIESIEQASTPGGRIRIAVRRDASDRVKLTLADTGHGLPRVSPDKIFGAFFSTKRKGLGIGLSLCRSVVESHHGHMWMTATGGNEGQRETRCHVLLPGCAAPAGLRPLNPKSAASAPRSRRRREPAAVPAARG